MDPNSNASARISWTEATTVHRAKSTDPIEVAGPTALVRRSGCVHMIRPILSYACLFAGVIGLVAPFLPGIPLLILGSRSLDRNDWLARLGASLLQAIRKSL